MDNRLLSRPLGCPLELSVDRINRIIHLLDLDLKGGSLSEVMGDRLMGEVLNILRLDGTYEGWIWLLYHRDGMISQWVDDFFTPLSSGDPRLRREFVSACVRRAPDLYGGTIKSSSDGLSSLLNE